MLCWHTTCLLKEINLAIYLQLSEEYVKSMLRFHLLHFSKVLNFSLSQFHSLTASSGQNRHNTPFAHTSSCFTNLYRILHIFTNKGAETVCYAVSLHCQ